MKWWQYLLAGVLCGLLAGGLIVIIINPKRGKPVELLPPPTQSPLLINVIGAVNNPGVYQLAPGSRVSDAIQAAGGASPEADITLVNLAAVVTDGQRLWIPLKIDQTLVAEENTVQAASGVAATPELPSPQNPVNINTASESQLDLLPGIGPVKAAAIISYRQQNGPFTSIEEITSVPGISDSVYDGIKDLITIAPKQ
jgi:competence protein ComEA